ncbi:partial Sporulation kinase D, partial [Methylococcales bacterium]
ILAGALLFLKFRILQPLNDLRHLLERLTEENFTPIKINHLDPLLLPVFDSYNQMVKHLAELEESKRLYAQSLQHEVRVATQALLEQQANLARSERLAAVGEMAAELAHEIRNPLAGIQMAFNNLRREINNEIQSERVELISSELKRLTVLLNDLLNQSKHSPENAKTFDLSVLIKDLVTLARYQIPENVLLNFETPQVLFVHLPESVIRQVLLNLILNSVEALEGNSGSIMIKAWIENASLILKVSDTGRGFPEDMLAYGIRPFRTSHAKGTGLGLAMVQRFIKNMDGTIKLANQEPQGACVIVSLPHCLIGGKH